MQKEHIITIDSEKCIGCGMCLKDCPAANMAVENRKARSGAEEAYVNLPTKQ